jgi:hypothetical protein
MKKKIKSKTKSKPQKKTSAKQKTAKHKKKTVTIHPSSTVERDVSSDTSSEYRLAKRTV